jgi:flavin reductase (DIM6/NTAB) family NADH-FMN oxidoreductase RutF
MTKIKLSSHFSGFPMPMVLVGSVVQGQPNFMAVAWVTYANFSPPMLAVSLGSHLTNAGIEEHGQFSVNVPSEEMVKITDYCGLVSGKKQDKSNLFELERGELEFAPLIKECPFALECTLFTKVSLPSSTIYIGEIAGIYAAEECLTNGSPDPQKIRPFVLTMPDNRYWAIGDYRGAAWGSGKDFIRKQNR